MQDDNTTQPTDDQNNGGQAPTGGEPETGTDQPGTEMPSEPTTGDENPAGGQTA